MFKIDNIRMPVWPGRLVHAQVGYTTQFLKLRQVQLSSWVSLYDLLPAVYNVIILSHWVEH